MTTELNCFQLNYRITNISSKEIIVKIKGGLSYIVQRGTEATYMNEQQIHVVIENVYLDNLRIDVNAALTKLDKAVLVELSKEHERLKKSNTEHYIRMPVTLRVQLDLHKGLVERNNAIHSELLGITMYLGSENLDQPCLNTPAFTMKELFENPGDESVQGKAALHYFVYVNDPQRVNKPLWTNIMGKSTEVPVDYDANKQPGLYVGISRGIEPRGTQYYAFGELDDQKLTHLGLFKTKVECDAGGNTERFLTAESKNRDLNKDANSMRTQIENLTEALGKSEATVFRLNTDLTKVKEEHKLELNAVKMEHRMEANTLKHSGKMASDLFKFETRIKDTVNKANTELVKQKGAQNSWGDLAKAVGTLAGVAITGYKLLTA
jgi:hypothetical protein